MDYGERMTEARFRALRSRVDGIYRQAYRELDEKAREFAEKHKKREQKYRQQLADGKISQDDFDAWMRGQVFQGEQWEARKRQMEQTLFNADKTAQAMINADRYDVFADNANYAGYDMEQATRLDTSFTLYDANTVRLLAADNPDLLPPKKDIGKDKSYQWYNREINNAITQGIVQGEDLRQIAKRIARDTCEKNDSAMLRNARTMFTGCQNAGRVEGMNQSKKLGIRVQKRWMATLDGRTRDAHADLDGQIVDTDAPFKSKLGSIMYPGDPNADPANVWNCRCTLISVYPDYPASVQRRDNETGEIIGDVTYKEWEAGKKGKNEAPESEKRPEGEQHELSQFNRYNPETRSAEQKLEQINPNYRQGGNWAVNCQRTVVAQELVYRGYDVTAKPRDGSDPIKSSGVACWKFKTKEWWKDPEVITPGARSNFKSSIKSAFDQWGDGARAIVRVQWSKRYGGSGHFFTARYENGKIIYEDPQTNKIMDIDETLKLCTTSRNKLWFMRVDNREVTDNVKYAVKNMEDKNG